MDILEILSNNLQISKKRRKQSLICLFYAQQLVKNQVPIIFDIKHLALHIGIEMEALLSMIYASDYHYSEKIIPKKSGGIRELLLPSRELKNVQRWILDNILYFREISSYAHGFCKNKSIVSNALQHIGNDCILNVDISNFFPTISFRRIFLLFFYIGYSRKVSYYLAKLCTYDGYLPQGAPTSPYLSNLVCKKLDFRLAKLAEKYEANYTRYADDITLSGGYGIQNCLEHVENIIADEGFALNKKKTRVAFKYQRQEITGVIVNGGSIRVNKKFKRKIFQEIYYCIKYGVSNHLQHIRCNKSFYKEHLYGKAYFINMIEPAEGKKALNLLSQVKWEY